MISEEGFTKRFKLAPVVQVPERFRVVEFE
jgi:hypothetical protein